MKRITHNADDRRRQVVPKDFSFLSDADSDVVSAMFYAMASMFGLGPDDVIVLTGCKLVKQESGGQKYYKLNDGLLLRQGTVYAVRGVPAYPVSDWVVLPVLLNSLYAVFGGTNVSPSPVYEYGEGQVYCHEDAVVTELSGSMAADCVKLSDLKALPVVGEALSYITYTRVYSVETQEDEA